MFSRAIAIVTLGFSLIFSPFASGESQNPNFSPGAQTQAAASVGTVPGVHHPAAGFIPPEREAKRIALMFVGHGEPAAVEDGDVPIVFPDGSPFGPHGAEAGVPEAYQHTEWAAAYEEIATALTYIFGDMNGNGIEHEVAVIPEGDVPDFFTWEIFHATIYRNYELTGNYSPHNDSLREHVSSLTIGVRGAQIDVYLALLDDVPRIPDVVHEIANGSYDELVVVPMLVSNSTHTDEITGQMEDVSHLTGDMEVLVTEPFFEVPYMRKSLGDGIVAMAHHLRKSVPSEVEDHNIGPSLHSKRDIVVGPRAADLHVDRLLPAGDLPQFEDLDLEVVRAGPVGVTAGRALVNAFGQVAHFSNAVGYFLTQQHAAPTGLGALSDHDFNGVRAAQVVGVHPVARGQVLVDEFLGMPALLLGHAAVAGRRRGARHRCAAPQRLLGVRRKRAEAHPGDGDRDLQFDRLLREACAKRHARFAFFAIALERVARNRRAEHEQVVVEPGQRSARRRGR